MKNKILVLAFCSIFLASSASAKKDSLNKIDITFSELLKLGWSVSAAGMGNVFLEKKNDEKEYRVIVCVAYVGGKPEAPEIGDCYGSQQIGAD